MRYIALLRGINVGGNHRVEMKRLKQALEDMGCFDVKTYINSGNAWFSSEEDPRALSNKIPTELERVFGFSIPALVKTQEDMRMIAESIPAGWENDDAQKTDVAYLFADVDVESIVNSLPIRKEFVDVRYVPGALIWNVKRADYHRSHLNKVIEQKLYKSMTVRNVNTARILGFAD